MVSNVCFYTVSARQGPLPGEGVEQTITLFSSSHKASISLGSVVIFRAPNLPIKRRRENITPPLPPSVKRGKLNISLMVFQPTYIFNENKCNHHSFFIPDQFIWIYLYQCLYFSYKAFTIILPRKSIALDEKNPSLILVILVQDDKRMKMCGKDLRVSQ